MKTKKSKALSNAQLESLKGDKYGVIFMMMYSMGLRYSEVSSIEYGSVVGCDSVIIKSSKGSNSKVVSVSSAVKQLMSGIDEFYFNRLKSVSKMTLNRRMKSITGETVGISTHSLRKSVAMKVYEKTNDVLKVQSILGHKSLSSTTHYLSCNYSLDVDKLGISI